MLHTLGVQVSSGEQEYWMLVCQDERGMRRLVKDNMSQPAAARELKMFTEAAESKPHKQQYFIFPYRASNRQEVLARERVGM